MVWGITAVQKAPLTKPDQKEFKRLLANFLLLVHMQRDHCSQKGRDCQGHCQLETALTEVALALK